MKNQASAGVSRSCVAGAMQAGRSTTIATFQIFDLTGAIWHTNTRHFQVEDDDIY